MKRIISILLCVLTVSGCASLETPSEKETGGANTANVTATATYIPTAQHTSAQPDPTAPVTTQTVPQTDKAELLLQQMSLEQRVGQLFIIRCPQEGAQEDIVRYSPAGFVLFARDFKDETPQSARNKIQEYQQASAIPMLMAVDEEGGTVTRISRYPAFRSEPFLSPRKIYQQQGLQGIIATETEKCQLLKSVGVNVNLAPVCDVTTDKNAFMFSRSLGQSPQVTGDYVKTVVRLMRSQGVGAVLKHFPGYGNNTDTHKGVATDNRPLSRLEAEDLVPFAMGIEADCDAIMISHVYINAIDDKLPATLSEKVHLYLKEQMGFNGVIMTDDLAMQGITEVFGAEEAAVTAVLAGNHLLCSTDYPTQYNAVLNAVKNGQIPQSKVDEAALKVIKMKMNLGLIQ